MKKILSGLLLLIIAVSFLSCGSSDGGTGSFLFSTKPIKKGEESKVETKKSFKKGESIYGRAYLTEEIGIFKKYAKKDDFTCELYIDGKLKYTYHALQNNSIAKPEYKEFIFYIYKTSFRPDFPPAKFKRLSAGKHNVKLVVKRIKYIPGSQEYKVIKMAEGEFEFIK